MTPNKIKNKLSNRDGEHKRKFALLIDPDKYSIESLKVVCHQMLNLGDRGIVLLGGSLLTIGNTNSAIEAIKAVCPQLDVVLFPGSPAQLTHLADGVLFFSLISSRNADLLIGRQVESAPFLMNPGKTEILATGYMLIDGGAMTTANYISNSMPIPRNKPSIAAATALAGVSLGMQFIYADTGSGAPQSVPMDTIKAIRTVIGEKTLIVGGGINSPQDMESFFDNGADWVVVGSAVENNPEVLKDFIAAL